MKRKIITLLLAFAMVLSCTACGDRQDTVNNPQKGPQSTSGTGSSVTKPEKQDALKRNDRITLGTYEQDNNLGNGQEPIVWMVADKNETGYLLISEYGLDFKKYHNTEENVTWETSDIRSWLNGEFFNNHFTAEEQAKILLTTVDNSEELHPQLSAGSNAKKYGYQQSNDTQDHIFLLSVSELVDLSYSPSSLLGFLTTPYSYEVCTQLAKGSNIYNYMNPAGGACVYLTRSLTANPKVFGEYCSEKFGKNVSTAVYVVDTGHYTKPQIFWKDAFAVVPAMWIDKDAQYEKVESPS